MPLGVLFMQSQAFFGADSAIHAELMKYFDRSAVEVFVAVTNSIAFSHQVDTSL